MKNLKNKYFKIKKGNLYVVVLTLILLSLTACKATVWAPAAHHARPPHITKPAYEQPVHE